MVLTTIIIITTTTIIITTTTIIIITIIIITTTITVITVITVTTVITTTTIATTTTIITITTLNEAWEANKNHVAAVTDILKQNGIDVWRDETGSSKLRPMSGDIMEVYETAILLTHCILS